MVRGKFSPQPCNVFHNICEFFFSCVMDDKIKWLRRMQIQTIDKGNIELHSTRRKFDV